jgi:hypothetical protein
MRPASPAPSPARKTGADDPAGRPSDPPTNDRPRANTPTATPRSLPAPAGDGAFPRTSSGRSRWFDWQIPGAQDEASAGDQAQADSLTRDLVARERSRGKSNQGLAGAHPSRRIRDSQALASPGVRRHHGFRAGILSRTRKNNSWIFLLVLPSNGVSMGFERRSGACYLTFCSGKRGKKER